MSGEEVTASTLSKDQDMKEAEMPASSKKAAADIAKVEQDIESAKSLAKAVSPSFGNVKARIVDFSSRC